MNFRVRRAVSSDQTMYKTGTTRRSGGWWVRFPGWAGGSRMSQAFTANFVVSATVVLMWLVHALRHRLPIDERFLGLPYIEGPPWIDVLVLDAFVLVCLFTSPSSVASKCGRFAVGSVGLAGATCILSRGTVPAPETALGLYVWVSHLATAVFWRSRRR